MPTVYRSIAGDIPTLRDFTSRKGLGYRQRLPFETEEKWSGISVFNNEAQCRKNAVKNSFLTPIAELAIEEDGPVTYSKTGSNGHRTVWGDPQDILDRVTDVIPR
jgi:hypothetical protein